MTTNNRVVIDTNVLVSFLLFPNSVPGQAVTKALTEGTVLRSDKTLGELAQVLDRKKFDSYLGKDERTVFLQRFIQESVYIKPSSPITVSRDAKDNKFLELAVSGEAKSIVTGDRDLLILNPFRRIEIITPAHFIDG